MMAARPAAHAPDKLTPSKLRLDGDGDRRLRVNGNSSRSRSWSWRRGSTSSHYASAKTTEWSRRRRHRRHHSDDDVATVASAPRARALARSLAPTCKGRERGGPTGRKTRAVYVPN